MKFIDMKILSGFSLQKREQYSENTMCIGRSCDRDDFHGRSEFKHFSHKCCINFVRFRLIILNYNLKNLLMLRHIKLLTVPIFDTYNDVPWNSELRIAFQFYCISKGIQQRKKRNF